MSTGGRRYKQDDVYMSFKQRSQSLHSPVAAIIHPKHVLHTETSYSRRPVVFLVAIPASLIARHTDFNS